MRGGEDTIDKLYYSLKYAGMGDVAKKYLRKPIKKDKWTDSEDEEEDEEDSVPPPRPRNTGSHAGQKPSTSTEPTGRLQ